MFLALVWRGAASIASRLASFFCSAASASRCAIWISNSSARISIFAASNLSCSATSALTGV